MLFDYMLAMLDYVLNTSRIAALTFTLRSRQVSWHHRPARHRLD